MGKFDIKLKELETKDLEVSKSPKLIETFD
jgi:hypothetical protein